MPLLRINISRILIIYVANFNLLPLKNVKDKRLLYKLESLDSEIYAKSYIGKVWAMLKIFKSGAFFYFPS